MATAIKTSCNVVDQITEWTTPDGAIEVRTGDLILHLGQFEVVASVTICRDNGHVRFTLESSPTQGRYALVDGLVAVRRYIETTED